MSKYNPLIREALRMHEMAVAIIRKYDKPDAITEKVNERIHLERILLRANEQVWHEIIQAGIPLPFDCGLN